MKSHLEIEQTIQRLVDNQLTDLQRRQLLLTAEQQPELWRQLAVAFIEDRVWSAAIAGPPAGQSWLHADELPPADKPSLEQPTTSLFQKPWWIALAAAALLTLTVAVRLAVEPDAAAVGPAPPGVTQVPPGNPAAADQPYMLQVNDNLQVPLYQELNPLREHLTRVDPQSDPALQGILRNPGLSIRPDVRYIRGIAPDGRSFVVPVQQFRIQPNVQ